MIRLIGAPETKAHIHYCAGDIVNVEVTSIPGPDVLGSRMPLHPATVGRVIECKVFRMSEVQNPDAGGWYFSSTIDPNSYFLSENFEDGLNRSRSVDWRTYLRGRVTLKGITYD